MANNHAHAPAPLGGSLLTPFTLLLGALSAIAGIILAYRFFYGLGAVTNINDGYPWGIWVAYDVVVGSALACGGFVMALLVYIFNKGQYHPLVRPALLASLFGYTLAGVSVIFDLGRWWNFWHIFWPGYAQVNSVMFEVAVCITAYIVVMWIEFSPAFLEKLGMKDVKQKLDKLWSFMIRSKMPGGRINAAQYLMHDRLAGDVANGTLRLTTRQGIQFHGVFKGDLKEVIAGICESGLTTWGACGDVVRNTMGPASPIHDVAHRDCQALAEEMSAVFLPRSSAYSEIWLDGEKLELSSGKAEPDEIYGETYLPRKFKIGMAVRMSTLQATRGKPKSVTK